MKDEYALYKKHTAATDKIFSPSFCLAKWYHANIYFQTGETHSCYHPAPHAIDLNLLKGSPSALHNTPVKFEERRQMLVGERPKGCQYCWNIEDLNNDLISDRQIRTGSLYKSERIDEIQKNPYDFQVNPEYVELSFSNLCNFKCGYCHPKASSRYLNEIKEFGPYTQSKNHRCDIDWFKIYEEENNPYLDAWWKWWPTLSKSLKILRITGGEPLLQKSTFRMLDFLSVHPSPELELNINSNLGMSSKIVEDFCTKITFLLEQKKIKSFKLFTSIDTWGPQAAYIRTGLDLDLFEKNVRLYLDKTKSPLTFMITFNIFSIPSFSSLFQKILDWRLQFNNGSLAYQIFRRMQPYLLRLKFFYIPFFSVVLKKIFIWWPRLNRSKQDYRTFHRIRFDLSYLKEPLQYDINILPKDIFLPIMEEHLQFLKSHVDDARKDRFSFIEYHRFLRTYEYMKSTQYDEAKIVEGRKDFYNFFSEFDRRRSCSLSETFSNTQLIDFWELCKNVATTGGS